MWRKTVLRQRVEHVRVWSTLHPRLAPDPNSERSSKETRNDESPSLLEEPHFQTHALGIPTALVAAFASRLVGPNTGVLRRASQYLWTGQRLYMITLRGSLEIVAASKNCVSGVLRHFISVETFSCNMLKRNHLKCAHVGSTERPGEEFLGTPGAVCQTS